MEYGSEELRDIFIGQVRSITEQVKNDPGVKEKDKCDVLVGRLMDLLDGAEAGSVSPITLSYDPQSDSKILYEMDMGLPYVERRTPFNTGVNLRPYFNKRKGDEDETR